MAPRPPFDRHCGRLRLERSPESRHHLITSRFRAQSLRDCPGMTGNTALCVSDAAHHHIFDLDIFFHAVTRAFAAETAFLDAAERRDLRGDEAGVDADHAGL